MLNSWIKDWLVYVAVALFLLGFLLFNGFLLNLDMVFVPSVLEVSSTSSNFLLFSAVNGLTILFDDVAQKIILCIIFILMGYGAHSLIRYLFQAKFQSRFVVYFAGLLYIFNPYVYSRFMAGQWLLLLGYCLTPFFLIALLKFLDDQSWRKAAIVAAWLIVISIVSLHTVGLLGVIAVPLISLYTYRHRRDWNWCRTFALRSLAVLGVFVVASSYWLVPSLLGHGNTAEAISGFGAADFTAFATNEHTLGVLGNVLTMQGFWGDAANLYLTPEGLYGWWLIPFFLLGVLVGIGVYKGWCVLRGLTVAFITMFVVAVILATGTSGSIFASFNEWLLATLPFFAGYREPQKFVAIIVLVYVVFASLGVQQVREWLKAYTPTRRLAVGFGLVAMTIPIGCAPLMLWGFSGQLQASDYPKDWYSMNRYLEQNIAKEEKVLALPWHMYMRFGFAGRIISNPMDKFFAARLIVSSDPEFKGARSYVSTDEHQRITRILKDENDVINKLKKQGIRYIIIAKEFDYREYDYLKNQKDLEMVRDTESLRLYKIESDNMDKV